MLRPDMARDPAFQARFRREAHSAASLNHPAIVAVYDTGEDEVAGNPVPYIVMEYVEGSTLRELLASGSRLVPERALEIADGILVALAYSHQQGIVHRDIKPANVMLTPGGEVKVMDFGIARAVADTSSTMTQTSAVMGTAQYLSPEQARGEQVDARSDLYSTGCLLYELLTGRPPFVGDSPVSVAYQHVREIPVPPSRIDPDVPVEADSIVLKALAKDREERYQNADQMRADIARALRGLPVAAPTAAALTQRVEPPVAEATSTFPSVVTTTQPGPERRGSRALGYTLLAIAVLAVFVLALLFGRSLFENTGGESVRVPDLIGLTQAKAEARLVAQGLKVGDVKEVSDENMAKGNVLLQSPLPNTNLEAGDSVDLTISTGPPETTVPRLLGLSLDEASEALREADLKLGSTKRVRSSEDRGTVTKADPAEGTPVTAGSQVNLEVASGSNTVPDVRGKTLDEARAAVEEAGFTLESSERPDPDPAKTGRVIEQAPGPDRAARLESTVRVVVALPPPEETPTPTETATPTVVPTDTGTPTP
jgi:serine/threonine-protein kinase